MSLLEPIVRTTPEVRDPFLTNDSNSLPWPRLKKAAARRPFSIESSRHRERSSRQKPRAAAVCPGCSADLVEPLATAERRILNRCVDYQPLSPGAQLSNGLAPAELADRHS